MARPRIARNAEQAKAIPIEQPIQIEIPPDGEVIVPADRQPDKAPETSTPSTPIQISTKQDDSELQTLKAQLETLKRTSEDNAKRAQEAAAREQALRQQYEDQGKNFQTVVSQRGKAEMDAINNGIAAAQAEAEAATQELTAYGETQDWGGVAKAQSRLSRAQTRLVQLEDAKANYEARLEQVKQQMEYLARQPQQQGGDPVQDHISRMTGINDAQRNWLRTHPDAISDQEKNSYLQAGHFEAIKKNYAPGSAEYFQYLEERLGYRQPTEEVEELQPQMVAAPPTREAPSASGRTSPTRITLTAEERQIAAASNISEIEYARQKLRLIEMKKQGRYGSGE